MERNKKEIESLRGVFNNVHGIASRLANAAINGYISDNSRIEIARILRTCADRLEAKD